MTTQPQSVPPPSIAIWLMSLFAVTEEGESILGDLIEEFPLLASESGVPAARSWFWRQTLSTLPRLAAFGFRTAPWMTLAAVAGGFLLRKLVAPLIGQATFAVIERYPDFPLHHFAAYRFFASTWLDIAHLISFLLIGLVVAFVAREREIIATSTLALIFAAMAVVGSAYAAIHFADYSLLWRLTWYFADSLAVVAAGALVRTHRLTAKRRNPMGL